MKPLLEITSVPIVLEYKTSSARIQRAESRATVELSKKNEGGIRMRSRPIRMNMDTVESSSARKRMPAAVPPDKRVARTASQPSANIASSPPMRREAASGGNAATYSATAQVLDNGRIQVNMQFSSEAAAQLTSQMEQALSSAEFVAEYPEATAEAPSLSVTYEIDKMSFDWSASSRNIEIEFVPADIEFSVSEYPSVVIEYVGDPLYVPPSADPNLVRTPLDSGM